MKKDQIDRFYTIYALLVTILILGFSWLVFESRIIYGAENLFSTKKQIQIMAPNDSLPETAQEIIEMIEKSAKPKPQFENIDIQEV